MENLKAFFMRRPERLLGRCGMLFLMAFFVMNLSSCNDDFIEDNGGEIIPPEEIVIPPVYMLLDGPYKWGVVLQSPNQKIPDRKTKCVIKTHINIKQNVIFGAKLKPV